MKTIFGIKGWDLNEYAISANAVLGIRDSGKTYTATKAAEELFDAGVPFIALDPIGVWHSLRIPGTGKGYPVVVAGGRHGDLPLSIKNAGAIVRAAMEAEVSLVLDLFSMELSKADWRRIVRETVEILLHENVEHGLRHIFIEEAAEFVPQRPQDMLVFSAVEKLVRMGGNSKLGCTLINQRSADLNKSVLELCANVFVHRQTGKNTILDLKKWFEMLALDKPEQTKIADSLPDLKSGQCWAFINDLKAPVRLQVPAKNSQHPDRRAVVAKGAEKRKPVPADAFVAQMTAKLAEKDKPKQAPAAKSASLSSKADNTKEVAAARADGLAEGIVRGWNAGFMAGHKLGFKDGLAAIRTSLINLAGEIRDKTRELVTGFSAADSTYPCPVPFIPTVPVAISRGDVVPYKPAVAVPAPSHVQAAAAPRSAGRLTDGLTKPQQRILDALAWLESVGINSADRVRAAMLADQSHKSSGFEKNVSTLKTGGYISYPVPGELALTSEGRAAANVPDQPPTTADLHRAVANHVSGPQWRMLDALCSVYPQALTREELAERSDQSALSSGFEKNVSTLRSFGFVTYPAKGQVAAAPIMFVEAG